MSAFVRTTIVVPFLVVISLVVVAFPVAGETSAPDGILDDIDFSRTVVLFYGASCPHCHVMLDYLESVAAAYPHLTFVKVEIERALNKANLDLFAATMERYDSVTGGYPRTVIGNRVFLGFLDEAGPSRWIEGFEAYTGYRNQIDAALLALNARVAARIDAGGGYAFPAVAADAEAEIVPIVPVTGGAENATSAAVGSGRGGGAGRTVAIRFGATIAVLVLYGTLAFFIGKRRRNKPLGEDEPHRGQRRRLWIGGGTLLLLAGLFATVAGAPMGAVAESASQLPFPLLVTAIALLDGFNPCAFTVLFILLSLLTYAERRRDMVTVGGVFIAASAAVYIVFIFAVVAIGSVAFSAIGLWALRVVGAGVLGVGVLGVLELRGKRSEMNVTSLSTREKASLSRRAGIVVRKFSTASGVGPRIAALGSTVVLAVIVNSVEFGCTAILPAVYMSSLITTFGPDIALPHVGWTLWYGVVYVLPMTAILVDFLFVFRSNRISEAYGHRLKIVGSAAMVVLGTLLLIAPGVLRF